jgi:pyruvate/2-oxoglutarate dehydrogenase complex dihydrolipoamide dehydrogenase (E3) component
MIQCQYLIIGSGQTGLMAAKKLAGLGKSVILVEQTILGGTYIHNYEIPKQIITKEAEEFATSLKSFKDNPATFSVLIKNRQKLTAKIAAGIQSKFVNLREMLKSMPSLTLIKGQANFVSKSLVEINSETERHLVNFDQCIVAVGKNQLIKPNLAGLDSIPFLYQHNVYLLQEIPSKLAILGFTKESLEVADIYSNLGVKVSIFEESEAHRKLSKIDRSALNYLIKKLSGKQVEFFFKTKIVKIKKLKTGLELTDNADNSFDASHVYIDLEENFNEENLGLSKVGITVSKKGVVTDHIGRTAKKSIQALGECNSQSAENIKLSMIYSYLDKEIKSANNDKKTSLGYLGFSSESESKLIKIGSNKINTTFPIATLALTESEAIGKYGSSAKTRTFTMEGLEGFARITYKDQTGDILGVSLMGEVCIEFEAYFFSLFNRNINIKQALEFLGSRVILNEV